MGLVEKNQVSFSDVMLPNRESANLQFTLWMDFIGTPYFREAIWLNQMCPGYPLMNRSLMYLKSIWDCRFPGRFQRGWNFNHVTMDQVPVWIWHRSSLILADLDIKCLPDGPDSGSKQGPFSMWRRSGFYYPWNSSFGLHELKVLMYFIMLLKGV